MMNVHTWHRLGLSAYLMFPATIIAWLLPEDSIFIWPLGIVILWGILVCTLGAIQGVRMVCGRLYMGCPICDTRSKVLGGNHDGIYLDCPRCGDLRVNLGRLSKLRAVKPGSDEDDLADVPAVSDPYAAFLAPVRHPVSFAAIYLPVLLSVIGAAVIHEFSFFYLLIPGFWCYGVGGLILEGIYKGHVSDNQGTAVRSKSPVRFWGKMAIWSLFYVFAAAFPIGFALQERGHAPASNETDAAPKASTGGEMLSK
jgi:hypothetical protein